MPCFRPIPAWIDEADASIPAAERDLTKRMTVRKPALKFKQKGTQLDPDYELPCGKCNGCLADKAQDWGIRLWHEAHSYKQNAFITLTYDEEHLPDDRKLVKSDAQKFLMQLRNITGERIRYFLTGEYGDTYGRPHYHAIIFGFDFLAGSYPWDDILYDHPDVDHAWGHKGHAHIGSVEPASCFYVGGYVSKKVGASPVGVTGAVLPKGITTGSPFWGQGRHEVK